MSLSDNTAYFLGFEGEQSGPFSFADLSSRITSGSLNPDTLIWWEGQSDWQIISTLPEFQKLFSSSAKVLAPAPQNKPFVSKNPGPSQNSSSWIATYAKTGVAPVPIYSKKEGSFGPPIVIPVGLSLKLISLGVLGLLVWGLLNFLSAKPEKKNTVVKTSQKEKALLARQAELQKASNSLLLEPSQSAQTLTNLIDQNPDDAVGKEATRVLINFFEKNKDFRALGNLYRKIKQPDKAAEYFSKDPNLAEEAAKSFFEAYEKSSGKLKADFLIENIKILLSPLENYPLASERITLFEKTFPALTHPFSYYQMSASEKIGQIFPKVSSTFSEALSSRMREEFPQITFSLKPKVEVKRDVANHWRLIGSYRGDIFVRSDRITNVYFVYWFVDNQWNLVDTNLTPERARFASQTRKKLDRSALSQDILLSLLEKMFKQTYPGLSFHENLTATSSRP